MNFFTKKTKLFAIAFLLSSLIIGCSSSYNLSKQNYTANKITTETGSDDAITEKIEPYKSQLSKEMNIVIGEADCYMGPGQPESTIGNFVADLLLEYGKKNIDKEIDIAFVTKGGIRTDIGKGKITKSKIFELMPFDNEMIILEVNKNLLDTLVNFTLERGGDPISGMTIVKKEDGSFTYKVPNHNPQNNTYKILISDYLAGGGDKMKFWKHAVKKIQTGKLFRDIIIEYIQKKKNVCSKLDDRIKVPQK